MMPVYPEKKKKKNHLFLIHLLVMYPASKECYFGRQIGVGFGLSQSCPDVTPFCQPIKISIICLLVEISMANKL